VPLLLCVALLLRACQALLALLTPLMVLMFIPLHRPGCVMASTRLATLAIRRARPGDDGSDSSWRPSTLVVACVSALTHKRVERSNWPARTGLFGA
jgi:hypothetical protein